MAVALETKTVKRGFWAQLWRLPRAWIGTAMAGIVILCAVFAPLIAPNDPLLAYLQSSD